MAAKKTFMDNLENPAELFISKREEPAEERGQTQAPKGYHMNPLYIENKSKRVQLLMKPSTVERLKARASAEGRSLNDIINTILEDALAEYDGAAENAARKE